MVAAVITRLLEAKPAQRFRRIELFQSESQQSNSVGWQNALCNFWFEQEVIHRSGPTKSRRYSFTDSERNRQLLVSINNPKAYDDLIERAQAFERSKKSPNVKIDNGEAELPFMDAADNTEESDNQVEFDSVTVATRTLQFVHGASEAIIDIRDRILADVIHQLDRMSKTMGHRTDSASKRTDHVHSFDGIIIKLDGIEKLIGEMSRRLERMEDAWFSYKEEKFNDDNETDMLPSSGF